MLHKAKHKIQTENDALTLTMQCTPKMLSLLTNVWAPKAYVVSFKVSPETTHFHTIPTISHALMCLHRPSQAYTFPHIPKRTNILRFPNIHSPTRPHRHFFIHSLGSTHTHSPPCTPCTSTQSTAIPTLHSHTHTHTHAPPTDRYRRGEG